MLNHGGERSTPPEQPAQPAAHLNKGRVKQKKAHLLPGKMHFFLRTEREKNESPLKASSC